MVDDDEVNSVCIMCKISVQYYKGIFLNNLTFDCVFLFLDS